MAAKLVSSMAFLSPSPITAETFDENKIIEEEPTKQYQQGFHTAILMAKKHWPDAPMVIPASDIEIKTNKTACESTDKINVSEQILIQQQSAPSLPPPESVANTQPAPLMSPPCSQHGNQVQVATQTQVQANAVENKSSSKVKSSTNESNAKNKKNRYAQPRVTQEPQFPADNAAQFGSQPAPQQQPPLQQQQQQQQHHQNTILSGKYRQYLRAHRLHPYLERAAAFQPPPALQQVSCYNV
uniref:Putative product n=1 Tax=Xenopsylla cheopis TaxID=163159 RepID=A0A6M2DZC9_XENCH